MLTSVVLAWYPGPMELGVIALVALLLFGRRLPEVMRNMGKGIVEFKRGVRGVEDQIDEASSKPGSDSYKEKADEDAAESKTSGRSGSEAGQEAQGEPEPSGKSQG